MTAEAEAVERLCQRLAALRAIGLTLDAIEAATGVTVAKIERLLEEAGR